MKIDEIKLICEVEQSELLFDISSPPEYQCSHIDEIIRSVKDCESWTSSIGRTDTVEDCHSTAHDIEWELASFYDKLEKIRKKIEELRSWGQQWKDLARLVIERNTESLPYILEDDVFLKFETYLEHENNNS